MRQRQRIWPASLLKDLGEAIRGTCRDLTEVPLRRAIFLLAVPMALESSLSTLFTFCDTWFIGRLGAAAMASVGVVEALQMVVYAVAQGLAVGTLATVSRRIGEKDRETAALVTVQAIFLALVSGLVLSVGGAIFAVDLLRLMGVGDDVMGVGTAYAVHLFGGSITVVLLVVINAALRGSGASALTLRVLGIAHAINLVLDPILIFGLGPIPALGVKGAAIATYTGRSVAIAYQLRQLTKSVSHFHIERCHLRLDPEILGRLVRLSGMAFVQNFLTVMSTAGLLRVLAPFPAAAVAGYTLVWRITTFVIPPIWGVAGAAGILLGQNLGAGKTERAEATVWATARYNLVVLGTIAALCFVFAPAIIGFFTPDAEAIVYGSESLRWMSIGYLFMAYGLVMRTAFNAAGDPTTPTWIYLFSYWGVKVFLAWVLAWPLGLGPTGVFIAAATTEVVAAVAGVVMFRRGRWKNRQV